MMRMRVTLAEIAAAAGVNKTTVSKAMRGGSDISAETRKRVVELARQMGYAAPARAGRADTGLVGVICPEVTSHYYARIAEALNERLLKAGRAMVLSITGFDAARERDALARFREIRADAVICITEQPDMDAAIRDAFPDGETPAIIMGIDYRGNAHDVISVDERFGVRRAVEQLARLGHTRFAFIGDRFVEARLSHMREALAGQGFTLAPECAILQDLRGEACGYQGMRALLALSRRPTAVVAGYDAIALGAYRALCEAGLSVPGDVSLAGFDNAPFCAYLPASLTTINSNIDGMCAVAIAIIEKKLRQPGASIIQRVAIQPEFLMRESIGPARNMD